MEWPSVTAFPEDVWMSGGSAVITIEWTANKNPQKEAHAAGCSLALLVGVVLPGTASTATTSQNL
jgi:hypothetical protein